MPEPIEVTVTRVETKVDNLTRHLDSFMQAILDPETGYVPRSEIGLMRQLADSERVRIEEKLWAECKRIEEEAARERQVMKDAQKRAQEALKEEHAEDLATTRGDLDKLNARVWGLLVAVLIAVLGVVANLSGLHFGAH